MLDQDNYQSWKKELVKSLKDWDKMYVKHAKAINPEVVTIQMHAFEPLTQMWMAN